MMERRAFLFFAPGPVKAILTVAGVVSVATLAGPLFAFVPALTGARWLPAGIGMALLLLYGLRVWPVLLLGTFGANIVAGTNAALALAFALSATAEAYAGALLTRRWAGGRRAMRRTRSFVMLAVGSALVASLLGPALASVGAAWLRGAPTSVDGASVLSWWFGDMASMLVLAPLMLSRQQRRPPAEPKRRLVEHVLAAAALGVTWFAAFGGRMPAAVAHAPIDVVCIPAMLWTAYRFGLRTAALAEAGLALVALRATQAGLGPFAFPAGGASLVALHAFVGVTAMTSFALAIVAGERRAAEAQLEQAARTDALTGLANYGHLMDVLEAEVSRALRSGQGFAVLFVDVDHLKRINDGHGHLAGNAAIRLVANTLRMSCRSVDTVARIGGDEFCALLPEADEATALRVARRIARSLRASSHHPPVTVSTGIAVYPRDGGTPQALLAAADVLLYGAKGRRVPSSPRMLHA